MARHALAGRAFSQPAADGLAARRARRPCESQLIPRASPDYQPSAYEQRHDAWFLAHLDTAFAMDAMELDYLLRHDPQHPEAKHWREALAEIWEEARLALAPDGTTYVGVLVDMETGEPRRPDPEFRAPPSDDDKWIGFRYVSGGRSANATLLARAAVQASLHCSDPGLPEAARRIVRSLDASCMRNYLDEDRYIPSLKHLSRYLGGDAVTNWLWAYWQGRAQGIFEPDDTCLPTPALCHGGAAVPEDQATVTNG